METVGTRLRKTREKKGLTLDNAQKALKIHPSILKALEENNAHKFLSPVYIRSFLRSYARYLGLDAERIVEEHSKTQPEKTEQVLVIEPKAQGIWHIIRRYMPLATKIIIPVLVSIIAIVVVVSATRSLTAYIAKRSSKVKTVEEAKPAAAVKKPAINIPQSQPLILIIKTKDEVWIQVKSDEEIVFGRVLPSGSVEKWEAKEKIELWVGKAHALELILNGIPLGTPGRGVKKGILITHRGMQLP